MKRFAILLFGLISLVGSASTNAQVTITGPAASEHLMNALELANEGDYAAAVDELRAALSAPGLNAEEKTIIYQSLLTYLVQIEDYETALANLQSMMSDGIGDPRQNAKTCARLAEEVAVDAESECPAQAFEAPDGPAGTDEFDFYVPPSDEDNDDDDESGWEIRSL